MRLSVSASAHIQQHTGSSAKALASVLVRIAPSAIVAFRTSDIDPPSVPPGSDSLANTASPVYYESGPGMVREPPKWSASVE
jgi:hypothetical protein